MAELSDNDRQSLTRAKQLLENPGLAVRMSELLGAPIEKGFEMLPANWNDKIGDVTQTALSKATEAAMFTLQDKPHETSSNLWHKLGAAVSGGVGGFFGLAAISVELPVSTTIILRSIADIARSEGESIADIETKMACLEVFALGGKGSADDAAETAYFSVRAALAKSITDTTEYIARHGLSDKAAPLIFKFLSKVAERFGIHVTQKAAAQALPALGAAGGAVLNTLFIDHFQAVARGHFIIRRLEREYGAEAVRHAYENVSLAP